MPKDTRAVINRHLELREAGDLETDLRENYHPDVVVLSPFGIFHGHSGMRESAQLLQKQIKDARYEYGTIIAAEQMALLSWTATGTERVACNGVDSFFVTDGTITYQTIYYSVEPKT